MKRLITAALLLGLLPGWSLAQHYELIPYRVNDQWGYADSTGKMLVKPQYEDAIPFLHGHAAFRKNGKWGILNVRNEVVLPPSFDSIGSSFEEYYGEKAFLDVYLDNEWQVIDTTGRIIPGALELEMAMSESDYVDRTPKIFQRNDLYGIRDYEGNVLVEPEYQKIVKPNEYSMIYFFEKDGKWGCINHEMEVSIENVYDSLIHESLCIAVQGDKMGLLDYNGREVLPVEYKFVSEANYMGFYIVNQEGQMGFADRNGKVQIEPQYNKIIKHFSNAAYSYRENGKWGYHDQEEEIYIEPKYLAVKAFKHGYAEVKTLKGKKGYINTKGEEFFKN